MSRFSSASLAFALLAALPSFAWAYDETPLNAVVPGSRAPWSGVATFAHAFGTKLTDSGEVAKDLDKRSLGLRNANVRFDAAYDIGPWATVNVGHLTRSSEWTLGVASALRGESLSTQISVDGFLFVPEKDYKSGAFLLWSGAALPLPDLQLALNAGYDSYNDHVGIGVLTAYRFLEEWRVFAEWFPAPRRNENNPHVGKVDAWDVGIRYETSGHQFVLAVTNSTAVNPRHAMLGAPDHEINWAFRISRLFE